MKRSFWVTVAAAVSLAGCSGHGSSLAPTAASKTSTQSSLRPYSIPIKGTAPANTARHPLSLGGIPQAIVGTIMDSPAFGPGDHVNIALNGVDVISDGSPLALASYAQPVAVDLLNYQSSAFPLGSNAMPPAKYQAVRLHVQVAGSSVVKDGTTYPMVFGTTDPLGNFVPSSSSTATLDMAVPVDNTTGAPTSFVIDFNVMESINIVNGQAYVTPTLRAVTGSSAAEITGSIIANNATPVVSATVQAIAADGSVAASGLTDAAGSFDLHGMPGGSYTIKVFNEYTTAAGQAISAVGNQNSAASFNGPSVSVPAGMSLNIQQIGD